MNNENEKKAKAIDWKAIICLQVAARSKDPEAAIFQPFTTDYLNDLVEAAVSFATEAADQEVELKRMTRIISRMQDHRASEPPDIFHPFGIPEPNCPCTVTPTEPWPNKAGEQIETAVNRFARDMEARMRANSHKGDWSDSSRGYLIHRLDRAVDDLKTSHAGRTYTETIIRRAADVANYAMMIADQEAQKAKAEKERPNIYEPKLERSE